MHMVIIMKDTGKWLTLGHPRVIWALIPKCPPENMLNPPDPFLGLLGPYHSPDYWDLGHLPLRCWESLHSQTCWSPPAVAAPLPGSSSCTGPCRQPAQHQGWSSALGSAVGPSVPSSDTLYFPPQPRLRVPFIILSLLYPAQVWNRGGGCLTHPCQMNLLEHCPWFPPFTLHPCSSPTNNKSASPAGFASRILHVPNQNTFTTSTAALDSV